MPEDASPTAKPIVVITGAAGDIGSALTRALKPRYRVVGMDRVRADLADDFIELDLASDPAVELAFCKFADRHGRQIAAVVHLAAYFDFTGENSPLYDNVNVRGTGRVLRALQEFEVGQFVYSSTMLVHRPCHPGERIDESTKLEPKWAYPRSKAASEAVIRAEHGKVPYVILRLAGLYDERTSVPTMSHQIARIYERDFKGHFFSGDVHAGQSLVHKQDAIDAFVRAIDRRAALPPELAVLVGEPDPMSYSALQDALGCLIHGEKEWSTFEVPKPVARAAAWAELHAEPVVPDVIDGGEKPFIRPFMIAMADDHYALDIGRAREVLGWQPQHRIRDMLPAMVKALKDDPGEWYKANRISPPGWLESADEQVKDAESLRAAHERGYRADHQRYIWTHFLNLGMASWLIASPPILGYGSTPLAISDIGSGLVLAVFALLSLSWRFGWARWACAAVGLWLLFAPLVFWTSSAAGYLNGTLVGSLVIGFAVLTPPTPGISAAAACSGPTVPPGWDFNPSSWFQRLPLIALAFIGLYVSRYLAAYQLGHVEGVWEPFFAGGPDPKNGTEEIITSRVAEAWPVSDAGLGALAYILEILTGILGSTRRWRTMPWLVVAFGIMIVPLGGVSIFFIIIQPILLGTWCTLCLIGAAAMLVQIPYSLDELVATGQFLLRRKRAGHRVVRVFFTGDTDEGTDRAKPADFERPPGAVLRETLTGGINVPWNLALCVAIGIWLMFTRPVLGAEGGMANADHLIGSLVVTLTVTAFAEVGRAVRFLNMPLGFALLFTPFIYGAPWPATIASLACGIALIALSVRRGPVQNSYGSWDRFVR